MPLWCICWSLQYAAVCVAHQTLLFLTCVCLSWESGGSQEGIFFDDLPSVKLASVYMWDAVTLYLNKDEVSDDVICILAEILKVQCAGRFPCLPEVASRLPEGRDDTSETR
jgi:hypothetical protein